MFGFRLNDLPVKPTVAIHDGGKRETRSIHVKGRNSITAFLIFLIEVSPYQIFSTDEQNAALQQMSLE